MKFKYFFWLAYKNLAARKLRTFLTTTAITIGVTAIVFLVSLGFGFQDLVTKQVATLDSLSNIKATSGSSKIIKIDDAMINKIKLFGNVEKVEPLLTIPGKLKNQKSVTDVVIYGAGESYLKISEIPLLKGDYYSDNKNEILINKTALDLLGISEKDALSKFVKLDFTVTKNMQSKEDGLEQEASDLEYKIVGIVDANSSGYVFVPPSKLNDLGADIYSEVLVKVKDKETVEVTRKTIENSGLKTEYIGDTITQIDQVFNTFQIILAGVGLIALIIASLGMLNTLTVSLLEKTREVGFLKALGVKNSDVLQIFLSESVLISFLGGMMGLGLGYAIGVGLNELVNFYAVQNGNQPVTFFITPWWFIASISFFSAFVGFFTGIFPARRAAKINPLDALRYE